MKVKGILIIVICATVWSCGVNKHLDSSNLISDIEAYISKVDSDNSLEESTVEGALTDTEGFEDIGTFKSHRRFNPTTKTLYRIENIENIENTGDTRAERYYFRDNSLVAVRVNSSPTNNKNIYLNEGKIISSSNIDLEEAELLIVKGERFKNEYKSK
ncbi:hypothetical protein FNB79_05245 [Formosa sediminum]|uniref:Uncharacterized protein n=1 Tax=Formosa sediminum TaxID=2594004 RepID=A0A516GPG2_9FLAO|nr:hypothetical protein [Formosa sediminum]QDO93405.1 hypothetical protein FNB79_05245 [Formosa sediminum]